MFSECYNILCISLFSGVYLIVITKKKKVGDLLGHAVWKAVDFDIISYKKTVLHLTDNQVRSECLSTAHPALLLRGLFL